MAIITFWPPMGHKGQELQGFSLNHLQLYELDVILVEISLFRLKFESLTSIDYYQSKLQNISKTEKLDLNYEILFLNLKLGIFLTIIFAKKLGQKSCYF